MAEPTTSAARLAANRANAQRPTGRRTPEGKTRSSRNAVTHGLFSSALGYAAAPLDEERAQYDALLQGLRNDHRPVNLDGEMIVDRMAALWWQLARVHKQSQLDLRSRLAQGAEVAEALQAGPGLRRRGSALGAQPVAPAQGSVAAARAAQRRRRSGRAQGAGGL